MSGFTVLDGLAESARARVAKERAQNPDAAVKADALALKIDGFPFEAALKKPGLSFICECKKASPSKGIIDPEFHYIDIAKEYEAAGADAVSVLTEPSRFLGSDRYLSEISEAVSLPCLRKDFTVDGYMIYTARILGAAAVLLICAVTEPAELKKYIEICDSLGLSALVETHDAAEIETALNAGARIIGVNNRNLKDFSVDTANCRRLRDKVPPEVIFVAESGINTAEDARAMANAGADAVLVGEAMMRAADKAAKLRELKSALPRNPGGRV